MSTNVLSFKYVKYVTDVNTNNEITLDSSGVVHPYYGSNILREERDDLIKLRKEEKNKIKICEREEARWRQNRMQYRNILKNINIDIIESNEKIKAELDKIDDLTEEDV